MTKSITPEERKQRTKELRLKHQPVFNSLGIQDASFVPKMAYNDPTVGGQLVMGFFESELSQCIDIYTEMVAFNMDPEDASRTLYKYRANPHFKSEYHNKPTGGGNDRYLIPVSELIPITSVEEPIRIESRKNTTKSTSIESNSDMLVGEMTVRDLAALLTGKKLSDKPWINDLVGTKSVDRKVTTRSKSLQKV